MRIDEGVEEEWIAVQSGICSGAVMVVREQRERTFIPIMVCMWHRTVSTYAAGERWGHPTPTLPRREKRGGGIKIKAE